RAFPPGSRAATLGASRSPGKGMPYPTPTAEQLERFNQDGFLVVENASDLLVCDVPQDADVVVCPIEAGTVTFHHSKTPHMTTGNSSDRWRLVLTQHFRNPACKDLAEDNYSWRVHVNQRTGQRVTETQ
ncbi:MAG TPA: phytanoyl-CoA dioxygenase family protein, partial [Vicinamibacterales bacterium]|nr:phytanoyl-CoA dioxygenase family protein [Vicinamibacterales bacterium]